LIATVAGAAVLLGLKQMRHRGVTYDASRAQVNYTVKNPHLPRTGSHLHSRDIVPPAEWKATAVRGRRLNALLEARHTRDITSELLPYLNDPLPERRARVVRAFAEMESPAAEAPLQARLNQVQAARSDYRYDTDKDVPETTLKLALAHIRTRSRKGETRIIAMAQSMGMSVQELVQLSQRLNSPRGYRTMLDPDNEILENIVTTMYRMIKRGERVDRIMQQLTLNPVQRLKLQASSLPPQREVKAILDYLQERQAVTGDDYMLGQHLVQIGPEATRQVMARLEQMKQQPELMKSKGYIVLFHVASDMKGPEALPLMQYFERTSTDKWVRNKAKFTRQRIEREEYRKNHPDEVLPPGFIVRSEERRGE
jgi:hypothetical protein